MNGDYPLKETHPPFVDKILTPKEVARMFRVDPKTVTRWAVQGKLPSVRTPGGHHRFKLSDIRPFLA